MLDPMLPQQAQSGRAFMVDRGHEGSATAQCTDSEPDAAYMKQRHRHPDLLAGL